MLNSKSFCVKSLLNLNFSSNIRQYLILKRLMAIKISRGQDPELIKSMPVFQYTNSDQISQKRKKRLYCWGYSGGGALGRASLVQRIKFRGCPTPPPIETRRSPMISDFVDINTNVIDVAAGFGFTVIAADVRDSSHRLFGCGIISDSQIGYHETSPGKPLMCVFKPVPIMLPIVEKERVIKVSCGRSHTLCLTNNGKVFSFGDNCFGQCGRSINKDEEYFGSRLVYRIKNIDEKVVDIVCGQDHTLLLTESGSVYSCGWGADGQTGLGHYQNNAIPTKLKGDIEGEKITQLSSAVDCVLAINDKGDVFGWGNSEYAQFDCVTRDKQLNTPRNLMFDSVKGKIVSVAAGGSLCALVNDLGHVYVWGYGILGMGPNVEQLSKPSILPMPLFGCNEFNPDVKVIKVEASLNHLAAITNKGDLFMWGKNKSGCLGLGHRYDQYFPLRVCVPVFVKKVSLGIDHTFIIGTSLI